MVPKKVYHASKQQNQETIKPAFKGHNKKLVYATKNKPLAALFLSWKGGDFTCQIIGGETTLVERFEGALDHRYSGISGSIYTLPGEKFEESKTDWQFEVTCKEEVTPLNEEKIEEAKKYLMKLKEKGKIKIVYHPNKPDYIPKDDSDLVQKAVKLAKQDKEKAMEIIEKYHPNLKNRVLKKLKEE